MTSAGDVVEGHLRLVRALMGRDGLDVVAAMDQLGPLIPPEDRPAVLQAYAAQTSTTFHLLEPAALVDGGPRPWFLDHNPAQGYYWRRQRDYLAHTLHRREFELDSLDRASNKVLSHLEDPHSDAGFSVRGLVVGHVQSGKTANFSALIAKAADAGYKIVIVLSGLHNSLRQQTQQRLERDLGREHVPGVGRPEPGRMWQWVTGPGPHQDFFAGGFGTAMLQGNQQVILVVKKNKSRLEALIEWMSGAVPPRVPVLVIDDEADQASINTRGNRRVREEFDLENEDFNGDEPDDDELDPSAINLNIRKLLGRFGQVAYVAYTATPFANVLIDPEAQDREGGRDLFPRNFIISLPQPPGDSYVGAAQLFGRDRLSGDSDTSAEDGLDVIEIVPDHEVGQLIPGRGQAATFQPTMPASMKQALTDFVIAAAARLERSARDQPCTMLVHTDMRRAMQNPLRGQVEKELAYIRQRWLYEAQEFRPQLEKRWISQFVPTTRSVDAGRVVSFERLVPHLDRLLRDGIEVRVLNSDWLDTADFDLEPTLKSVLIGGNKLSRGVTIAGLLVSYYVRETLYYDTLMQMGRWFGYRGEYVDLTRIYSTQTLISCFHDLATAEEDLRRNIGRYDREGLTPTQFVPKVRTHPLMAVTQKSKMRDAEELSISFAGTRPQTLRFPLQGSQPTLLKDNLVVTRDLLRTLGAPTILGGQPTWAGVDSQLVLDFIAQFQLIQQGNALSASDLADYVRVQQTHRELMRWRVLLACARRPDPRPMWSEDLGVEGMSAVPLVERTRLKSDPTSLGVVTDPDDELLGLDDEDVRLAKEAHDEGRFTSRAEAYRSRRPPQEGLLMLYPISAASQPKKNSTTRVPLFPKPENGTTIVAYAASLPPSTSAASVEYIAARGSSPLA